MSTEKQKGFIISDEDLAIFSKWIKEKGSVDAILKEHHKVLDACKRIDKMNVFTKEQLTTPFIPII